MAHAEVEGNMALIRVLGAPASGLAALAAHDYEISSKKPRMIEKLFERRIKLPLLSGKG
jgi:hypothetical protein